MYPSLFDSFFAPPTIIVVSEERLKKAELEQKKKQHAQIKDQLSNLADYENQLRLEIDKLEEPQSLEEALTGECDV
tara:strand:+ start:17 stop:244 length:228 start_codon:yes stop_codon:yes gene_type:complete